MKRCVRCLLAMALLNASSADAFHFTPIANVTALGGQYFTGVERSSGINVDWSFVPVLELNPRFFLIPVYLGSYHETQNVYNFLGENILITRQFDQALVLRSAWALNSLWRLKPRVGYKREWIQQSTDATLEDALFNYWRAFGGVSTERILPNGSIELGYEYGPTKYPNYQAVNADPRLTSTGITSSAGTDVLNFNSHQTTLSYDFAPDSRRWKLDADFTYIRQQFVDQKIITTTAGGFEDFEDENRADNIYNLALQQSWRVSPQWALGMGETFQYYTSNQNAFDGTQFSASPFTYHYYNFLETQLNPAVTLYGRQEKWQVTLGGSFGYRKYSHRRTQDINGNYEDKLIYSANRGVTLTMRYRILKGLYALVTGTVLTYRSNTDYEVNYPYNYTVSNYLAGLSWEY